MPVARLVVGLEAHIDYFWSITSKAFIYNILDKPGFSNAGWMVQLTQYTAGNRIFSIAYFLEPLASQTFADVFTMFCRAVIWTLFVGKPLAVCNLEIPFASIVLIQHLVLLDKIELTELSEFPTKMLDISGSISRSLLYSWSGKYKKGWACRMSKFLSLILCNFLLHKHSGRHETNAMWMGNWMIVTPAYIPGT